MVPQKNDPEKDCETCGTPLSRKRFESGRLEDRNVFLKRRFCSRSCANTKPMIQANSHRWRARRAKPRTSCETCGTNKKLHVHYIDRDVTNNNPENLAVLCASCHLKLHWREDGPTRLGHTRRPCSDGSRYLAEKPRSQPA